jgi:hypothetical protein
MTMLSEGGGASRGVGRVMAVVVICGGVVVCAPVICGVVVCARTFSTIISSCLDSSFAAWLPPASP